MSPQRVLEEMSETVLDVKGLLCPLPVLKARKALSKLEPGDVLVVEATDPASVIDVPHFCNEAGHQLVDSAQDAGFYRFRIKKAWTTG